MAIYFRWRWPLPNVQIIALHRVDETGGDQLSGNVNRNHKEWPLWRTKAATRRPPLRVGCARAHSLWLQLQFVDWQWKVSVCVCVVDLLSGGNVVLLNWGNIKLNTTHSRIIIIDNQQILYACHLLQLVMSGWSRRGVCVCVCVCYHICPIVPPRVSWSVIHRGKRHSMLFPAAVTKNTKSDPRNVL